MRPLSKATATPLVGWWQRHARGGLVVADGGKGPACTTGRASLSTIRTAPAGSAGWSPAWPCRPQGPRSTIYFPVFAPAETSLVALVAVIGQSPGGAGRGAFEETKGAVEPDQSELRS